MDDRSDRRDPKALAAGLASELRTLEGAGARCKQAARIRIRRQFKGESGAYVMAVARELSGVHGCRWFSRCLVRYHPEAFGSLDDALVEAFGQGIDGKDSVDSYARILSGPAWVQGLVTDDLVRRWARTGDRRWRRAALVSTVALNTRGDGGTGDAPRTLAVCRMLVDDRDDTVVQALSWALRALAPHDPDAVGAFLVEHEGSLAAPVKREVGNKLATRLQSPRRGTGKAIRAGTPSPG